jgi:hypothetical protein
VDISKECCNMLVWLMLAQAQECAHIKAVADNKSPGLLAKLAKQAASYYQVRPRGEKKRGVLGARCSMWLVKVLLRRCSIRARRVQRYDRSRTECVDVVGSLTLTASLPRSLARIDREQEAHKAVSSGALSAHFDKSWVLHVSIKVRTPSHWK